MLHVHLYNTLIPLLHLVGILDFIHPNKLPKKEFKKKRKEKEKRKRKKENRKWKRFQEIYVREERYTSNEE